MERFIYKISALMAFMFLTIDVMNSYGNLKTYSFGVVIIGTVISYFAYLVLSYSLLFMSYEFYKYSNKKQNGGIGYEQTYLRR